MAESETQFDNCDIKQILYKPVLSNGFCSFAGSSLKDVRKSAGLEFSV